MKIGLIDVDGHNFPNLALMKISAYHKFKGDQVEMYDQMSWFDPYDIVYMSKVFTFTDDFMYPIYANKVVKGGTGYDLHNKLPKEIEKMFPDYSLYGGINDTAYGFLTRGCPRACDFCIVAEKEGRKSYKVADLDQFWNGQKTIKLLDPNLLGSKDYIQLLEQLVHSKAYIDFTQGLDIRLMNDKAIDKIMQLKVRVIHFAWDKMKDSDCIVKKLKEFKKATNMSTRKTSVYVLTNFDTTLEEDLYRIYTLRELGYDPYVMIYDKYKSPQKIRYLQRWVNNKIIFKSCSKFENYNPKLG